MIDLGMLLAWAVANVWLLGIAAVLWRPLRCGVGRIDVLTLGLLHIVLASLVVLVTGLLGLLLPLPAFVLCGLAWAAVRFGTAAGRARPLTVALKAAWARWQRRERAPSARGRAVDLALGVVTGLVALRLAVHVWLLPPHIWDVLTYHLPKVATWIQAGRFVVEPTPVLRSFWPANVELYQTWFALFPHHDFLIDAAVIPFFLLACGAVFALARSAQIGHRGAWCAALINGLTPAVLLHATAGKNDLPVAALYLYIGALLLEPRVWRAGWSPVVAGLLACGYGVGAKPYFAMIAVGWLVLGAWLLWRHRRSGSAAARSSPVRQPGARSALVFCALVSVALAGFWYVRSWVLFGNPLFPVGFSLFGREIWPSVGPAVQQNSISLVGLIDNVYDFFRVKIFDAFSPYTVDQSNSAAWGWFVFAFGPGALLCGLWGSAQLRRLTFAMLLSATVLFLFVGLDPWNGRFVMWLPAAPVLAFVWLVTRAWWPAGRAALVGLALVALALNVVGTLTVKGLRPAHWRQLAALPVAERSSTQLMSQPDSVFSVLERIPAGEPFGFHAGYTSWLYPLYDADFSRVPVFVPATDPASIEGAMATLNMRYYFVVGARIKPEELARVRSVLEATSLVPVAEGLYVTPGG